ncbi:Ferric/cupric reductase transmembrane component 1 [Mycena kentingensis (nom. inval.)]|nr:Ferric/cupric reductase transmembrane component 1 [Mycena kentingensis (nom. inval.)]
MDYSLAARATVSQKPDPDRIPRIRLTNETPKQVWYFLATFMGLVALGHYLARFNAYRTRNRPRKPQPPEGTPLRADHMSWIRIPLALLNVYRTVAFRWAIGFNFLGAYTINMADFWLASVYLTILFCWTFINTTNSFGLKYDPKYWANRCAHIAAIQLPLMAALGMKNNPISFITGVSFDKLQHLHRATGRVIMVMFWVHGAGRVILPVSPGFLDGYWFSIGTAGTAAFTILAFISIRPIRVRTYEFFMYSHTALGVLGMAGSYIHCQEFEYGYLIWPAMFLWGLDRVIRLLRITLVNSQLFKHTPRRITSRATVTVLPYGTGLGFLRILVEAPHYLTWQPGQSMYLTMLGAYIGSVLESHPFTMANVPGWDALLDEREREREQGDGEKDRDSASGGSAAKALSTRNKLLFILRVRAGFTRHLRDAVLASPDTDTALPHSRAFPTFLDGPYSSPPVVRGYERVLFICGGSGVSFSLPLLLDLVHQATLRKNVCCSRAVFVWAIRDKEQIEWIAETLVRALTVLRASDFDTLEVDIRLHVTASGEYTQAAEARRDASRKADLEIGGMEETNKKREEGSSGAEKDASSPVSTSTTLAAEQRLSALQGVQIIEGRPDIEGIVDGEIAGMRGGAINVSVCGTTELAHSVRYALSNPVTRFRDVARGGPSVLLHIEGFGNA